MWRSVGEVKVSCNGCERVEGDANVVRRQGGQTSFEVHVESEGGEGKRSPTAAAAWSGERINRHSRWRGDRRDDTAKRFRGVARTRQRLARGSHGLKRPARQWPALTLKSGVALRVESRSFHQACDFQGSKRCLNLACR